MEEHIILSERLEDQLKAVEWARAEQKLSDDSTSRKKTLGGIFIAE